MKTMQFLIIGFAVVSITFTAYAKDVKTQEEFIKYNEQRVIVLHGKYSRDTAGRVIRYDVYDGKNTLLYYEIPYYKDDGSIIRSDTFAPDGSITHVVVFFGKTAKVFDKDGNPQPKFANSYSPFTTD